MPASTDLSALRSALQAASGQLESAGCEPRCGLLAQLARDGLATLPLPGSGRTLERWRAFAEVASHDLALTKLYEGHADALAILAEAGSIAPAAAETWGMWAAEAPGARVTFGDVGDGQACRLSGVKAWCSGARHLDRALLTVWSADGAGPFLADVPLRQPGVSFDDANWRAIGMAASDSVDVRFDGVPARLVGAAGFYLSRAGFWQGGAGIAACWHGATEAVARALRASAAAGAGASLGASADAGWHRLLALGESDVILSANAALLREAAAWIDANPQAEARALALRTRAATDAGATQVMTRVARALGATPLCRDARFARRMADLPVFIRQSHGDRDLAALGHRLIEDEEIPWML